MATGDKDTVLQPYRFEPVRWARACLRQPQRPSAAPQWEQWEQWELGQQHGPSTLLSQRLEVSRAEEAAVTLCDAGTSEAAGDLLMRGHSSWGSANVAALDSPDCTASPPLPPSLLPRVNSLLTLSQLHRREVSNAPSELPSPRLRSKLLQASVSSLLLPLRHLSGRINMPFVEAETPGTETPGLSDPSFRRRGRSLLAEMELRSNTY
ncbi:unnamed protein product [Pleuronectes platessa]|uniref:Uncharacterized protein n=1 Tax=Pleuronectes platessa TaxID=8262 RepID=A0A9N7U6M9_PLEPL|nr:unnamed protein product [Pleuronectes platessa]